MAAECEEEDKSDEQLDDNWSTILQNQQNECAQSERSLRCSLNG